MRQERLVFNGSSPKNTKFQLQKRFSFSQKWQLWKVELAQNSKQTSITLQSVEWRHRGSTKEEETQEREKTVSLGGTVSATLNDAPKPMRRWTAHVW